MGGLGGSSPGPPELAGFYVGSVWAGCVRKQRQGGLSGLGQERKVSAQPVLLMSPGGTIPSPLLCAGGALVPAAAAGDGPRARLDKPKNVARHRLRVLKACVSVTNSTCLMNAKWSQHRDLIDFLWQTSESV